MISSENSVEFLIQIIPQTKLHIIEWTRIYITGSINSHKFTVYQQDLTDAKKMSPYALVWTQWPSCSKFIEKPKA